MKKFLTFGCLLLIISVSMISCGVEKLPTGYKYFNWGMSMSEVEVAIDEAFDDGYFTFIDKTEDTMTYDVYDDRDPLFVASDLDGQFYDAVFSFKNGKLIRIELVLQSECSINEFDLAVEELRPKFGEPSLNTIDVEGVPPSNYATFHSDNSRISVLFVSATNRLTTTYTKDGEYFFEE